MSEVNRKFCPQCGAPLDEFGLCPRAMYGLLGMDLADMWRLVAQPKRKLTPETRRQRIAAIVSGPISAEHGGSLCCLCRLQLDHGVCPSCGLSIKYNSPLDIFLRYIES